MSPSGDCEHSGRLRGSKSQNRLIAAKPRPSAPVWQRLRVQTVKISGDVGNVTMRPRRASLEGHSQRLLSFCSGFVLRSQVTRGSMCSQPNLSYRLSGWQVCGGNCAWTGQNLRKSERHGNAHRPAVRCGRGKSRFGSKSQKRRMKTTRVDGVDALRTNSAHKSSEVAVGSIPWRRQ